LCCGAKKTTPGGSTDKRASENAMPEKKFISIKNAKIMPMTGTMDSFTAGVFSNDKCIESSLLCRGKESPIYEIQEKLCGAYVFGGYLFANFGHFILESLSRVYAIKQCAPLPILFLGPNPYILSAQKKQIEVLGVKNELLLVKKPIGVEMLIYSPPGSSIKPVMILDEQIDALAWHPGTDTIKGKKIWLSRSSTRVSSVDNEKDIEVQLQDLGWTIIHPEQIDLHEQVRHISSAEYIAGFDGSAFYSILFTKKCRAKIFIFSRRKEIPQEIPYALTKKNVEHEEFVFPLAWLSEEGTASRCVLKKPELLIDVLKSI
jgi:capsular polysaccharide biosynthesis protein